MNASTFPNRTLNGSSFSQLAVECDLARQKLDEAIQSLPLPHPRDYQSYGHDGAYKEARQEFIEQMNGLKKLRDFFANKRDHCLDQIKQQEKA